MAPSPTDRISYTVMQRPTLWRMRFEYFALSHCVTAAGEYSVEGRSLTVSLRRARMNMAANESPRINMQSRYDTWHPNVYTLGPGLRLRSGEALVCGIGACY